MRAYSEFMPPPYVGLKPYMPEVQDATSSGASPGALEIDEYEHAHDLVPGLDRIAQRIVAELGKLARGEAHALSHALLDGNPAWPAELAAAAKTGRLADEPPIIAMALALSRTQDDKGNARWTLFGTSHDGAGQPFWHERTAAQLAELLAWAGVSGAWRILAEPSEIPPALHEHLLGEGSLEGLAALVTFRPFAELPAAVREGYLSRKLTLFPSPASLVFFEHPRYRELATTLPHATQIPLLHLFPRVEGSCAIRIPQSGWLDEDVDSKHRVLSHVARTHRWQRVARDEGIADGAYEDEVSVALFSTDPDVLGLYDKPLARNVEIWTDEYALVLDGPRADRAAIDAAARAVDAGGRFGYRLLFPPMRGGPRALYWHFPLVARAGAGRHQGQHLGYVSAELAGTPTLRLAPRVRCRPAHVAAATQFERDPGRARHTTSNNARKLLDACALLGPLEPSFARALLRVAKTESLAGWLSGLPSLGAELGACVQLARDPGKALVLDRLGTREFEESIWRSIAGLAEGEYKQKQNADGITVNIGKTGGPAAKKAHIVAHVRRDLEALGDHLHVRHKDAIARHQMTGRAEVVDHVFRWATDFAFPWMEGWAKNQHAPRERNIVLMIPGKNRGEAIIMGDHYDTAFMEDVYDEDRGGDGLRAPALGADDNHSATTALLLGAEHLLELSRAGLLERDVWVVHLTGEEFPADSLGARAICQGLVEGTLAFTTEEGLKRDVSNVRVVGVYVSDMIGHNTARDRDVFQIAPGEGAASLRLARRAHHANERWNRQATKWNEASQRSEAGRAKRMPDGSKPPPLFSHLQVHGEVRVEWEPASALYNTDGQAFSDLGIPVVLFMENYDISRTGYHDTLDNMANIDLDYCAALTSIVIETVADAACAEDLEER